MGAYPQRIVHAQPITAASSPLRHDHSRHSHMAGRSTCLALSGSYPSEEESGSASAANGPAELNELSALDGELPVADPGQVFTDGRGDLVELGEQRRLGGLGVRDDLAEIERGQGAELGRARRVASAEPKSGRVPPGPGPGAAGPTPGPAPETSGAPGPAPVPEPPARASLPPVSPIWISRSFAASHISIADCFSKGDFACRGLILNVQGASDSTPAAPRLSAKRC